MRLKVPHFVQKTNFSCVPACLEQVFNYWGSEICQQKIIKSLKCPKHGMSIPAAGNFAIRKGFESTIITNNIHVFDPSWFDLKENTLISKLRRRYQYVDKYNKSVILDFIQFLKIGGQIKFNTIATNLIKKYLSRKLPIIVELASTYLYKECKIKFKKDKKIYDSLSGEIEGHAVVISGYNKDRFLVTDPNKNKVKNYYVSKDDLVVSIFISEGKSLLIIKK